MTLTVKVSDADQAKFEKLFEAQKKRFDDGTTREEYASLLLSTQIYSEYELLLKRADYENHD